MVGWGRVPDTDRVCGSWFNSTNPTNFYQSIFINTLKRISYDYFKEQRHWRNREMQLYPYRRHGSCLLSQRRQRRQTTDRQIFVGARFVRLNWHEQINVEIYSDVKEYLHVFSVDGIDFEFYTAYDWGAPCE